MAKIAYVKNLEKVVAGLRTLAAKAHEDYSAVAVVGYTQSYAAAVHENINDDGTPGKPNPPRSDAQRKAMFASIRDRESRNRTSWSTGQPKFLEAPARRLKGSRVTEVWNSLKSGKKFAQAILLLGLRLQRDSQQMCPVDTGALRASAFTRLE